MESENLLVSAQSALQLQKTINIILLAIMHEQVDTSRESEYTAALKRST